MARAKGTIPSSVMTPIIRRYIDEYQSGIGASAGLKETWSQGFGESQEEGRVGYQKMGDRFYYASAVSVLAEEAGVSVSVIYYHLQGKRQWISLNIADKLLCAMGWTHLWFCEPLSDYYTSTELAA